MINYKFSDLRCFDLLNNNGYCFFCGADPVACILVDQCGSDSSMCIPCVRKLADYLEEKEAD